MKHEKSFYRNLPSINGYKWAFFENVFHYFTKSIAVGFYRQWSTCKLTEDDVSDKSNMEHMLNNNLTRK